MTIYTILILVLSFIRSPVVPAGCCWNGVGTPLRMSQNEAFPSNRVAENKENLVSLSVTALSSHT